MFSSHYSPPSPPPSSPFGSRRIASDSHLERREEREDSHMLFRDWQLERRQLQMENRRLTKLLDDAHKHIALLQQERKRYKRDDDDSVCSSHAVTVKAGSSHYNKRSPSTSPSRRQKTNNKRFPKLFHKSEKWQDDDDFDIVAYNSQELVVVDQVRSYGAVCDVTNERSTCAPLSRPKSFSKAAKKHLDEIIDSGMDYSSTPSSPRPPSFAEF